MNLQKSIYKLVSLLFFVFVFSASAFSQFDQPSIQIGIGISEPMSDLKGTYYQTSVVGTQNQFIATYVNPDFMKNNYGAKTGFNVFGKGKINFDKYAITRGVAFLSFSSFNTFEPSKTGNIGVRVNINNQIDTFPSSASFNYTFNNFSFGLGMEVAPLSFTKIFSPYIGANIAFNSFSGKLSRTENRVDSVSINFSEFRIGANLDAGIEAKFNKTFGMSLGVKFDIGNILLRRTDGDLASRIEWGKTNATMNDDEGPFFSNIYSPVLTYDVSSYQSKKKNINWGTIYLAVNMYFNTKAPTKKAPTKK